MDFAKFKEKVVSDKAFAEKVKSLTVIDAVVAFGKENGYSFTAEDIKAGGKLSSAELDALAGNGTILAKTYFIA